jgi:hypothetical protein
MTALRRLLLLALLVARPAWPCPEVSVPPDAPDPYELQFGATNVNAALGSGRLTATVSRCGELTSLKWPGPSYYNQLSYLTTNAPDARALPHLGALDSSGAFVGIAWESRQDRGFSWTRDDDWTRTQHYDGDSSNVLVTEAVHTALGLRVTARTLILPDRNVLVLDHRVERMPYFPVADFALPHAADFAVVYDAKQRALLHFVPESAKTFPHDFSLVNPSCNRRPPAAGDCSARSPG